MDIINNVLVEALNVVGREFEKGTMFLPQLMMSAETVKNSFDAIKAHIDRSGEAQESKGKILVATVKGDIHDIGKNIVKVLLENYGYDVYDLGQGRTARTYCRNIKRKRYSHMRTFRTLYDYNSSKYGRYNQSNSCGGT